VEESYKVRLFERNNRSVKLTPAGMYLKSEVELLFNRLANISYQLEKIGEGKITSLKLGFIGSAVQTVLPTLLKELKAKQPLIDIALNELSNEIQLDYLRQEKLDFGFLRLITPIEGLQTIPIATEHFVLAVPKSLKLKIETQKEPTFDLRSVKEENFILFSKDYSNNYYDLVMSIFRDHDFVPNVTLRTVNALSIFNLVEQGLGIAIVPASLPLGYAIEVDFISLAYLPQRTTLSLVWNAENRNPGVPLLLEILKKIVPY